MGKGCWLSITLLTQCLCVLPVTAGDHIPLGMHILLEAPGIERLL